MMKRLTALALTCLMLLSMIPISVAAAGVTQPYFVQNFDNLTDGTYTADQLGYTAADGLDFTVSNKQLIIHNGTAAAIEFNVYDMKNDAVCDQTGKVVGDYVIELSAKITEDASEAGIFGVRFERNADDKDVRLLLRTKVNSSNNGEFRASYLASNVSFLDAGNTTFVENGVSYDRPPVSAKAPTVGNLYQEALGFPNKSTLDQTMNMRIEVDRTNSCIRVFINGIYITGTTEERWGRLTTAGMNGSKVLLRLGAGMKLSLDNVIIAPLYPTVTFNANGGTASAATMTTGRSSKLATLPTATRDGYTFDGWYTAADEKVTANTVFYADTTVKAKWTAVPVTPTTYPITFDANGGMASAATMTTGADGKLTALPTATRDGYTFDGWYTAADEKVTVDTVFAVDTTVKAKWTAVPVTPTTYTITFDANGGTASAATMTTGADGKLTALPTATRDGYSFDGWYTAADEKVTVDTVFAVDTAVKAKWTAVPVTPSLKQNFDNLPNGAISPAAIGWENIDAATVTYAIENGKLIVNNPNSGVTSQIVFLPSSLTDKLVKGDYTVEFEMTFLNNNNAGIFGLLTEYDRVADTFNIFYLRPTAHSNASSNKHAAFQSKKGGSWRYLDANGSEYKGVERRPASTNIAGETIWDRLGYTDQSAVNKPLRVRFEVDQTNKAARVFINDTFVTATSTEAHWNQFTESAGTELGFRISKNLQVAIDNVMITSTPFPVPQTYTITFDAAGGTIAQSTMVTNASGKLAFLPTALKTGYIFDGWFNAKDEEVTFETVFTADITLTAKWSEDPSVGESPAPNGPNLWLTVLQMRYNRKFDIKAVATEGGTITPAGTTQMKYNASQTYTIVPNPGYAIADVVVDDVSIGKVNSYTFKKVTKAHSIFVVFEKREATKTEVLYEENFDAMKSVDELGWESISTNFAPTAKFALEDGRLIIDNNVSGANTSYYVFAPSSITDKMVKDNYTVQFDMTFLDAASRDNLFSILFNYNRQTSKHYTVLYFRMRGDWNGFQNRNNSWANLDAGGTDYVDANGNLVTRSSIITKTAGKSLSDVIFNTAPSDMTLKDKKMTVRVEVDTQAQITRVFVNDIYLTGSNGKTAGGWADFRNAASGGTELVFRIGAGAKVAIDNVVLVTGLEIPKN
ncbi:MAG: InlB B-repeat-containing protein [Clostridia bacterium]|nr:InlB B-repeat-containing protein [Clostridia bacterium]